MTSWPTLARACALALTLAIAAAGFSIAAPEAQAADAVSAANKKHCKKTHRLRKGKCVRKRKPQPRAQPPDPLSDADGDGLPYQWETTAPPPPTRPRCTSKQRLRNGKCVRASARKGARSSAASA